MSKFSSVLLSRPVMLLMVGICLGFTFNLFLSTLLSKNCSFSPQLKNLSKSHGFEEKKIKVRENFTLRYKSKEELERVNNTLKIRTKSFRPRFVSTELGIRDKLISAVLTRRDSFETFGAAVNKTFQSFRSKMLFFMNFESSDFPPLGLSFVIFTHSREYLLPILSLKHLAENYIDKFNWFFLSPDTTYVDKNALEKFVDQLPTGDVIIAGVPSQEDDRFCDFEPGMLISQAALKVLSGQLQKCLDLVQPHFSPSQNLRLCFSKAFSSVKSICYNAHEKKMKYISYKNDKLETLEASNVISITGLNSERQFYIIHRQRTEEKLKLHRAQLKKLKVQSSHTLPFTPLGIKTVVWPLGSEPQTKSTNRFDLIKWQYFNNTTLYHDLLTENYETLKGSDKLDVKNVLSVVLQKLNKNRVNKLKLNELVNGYRRFDAARGAEYILDLSLQRKNEQNAFFKRVHFFKPLGQTEIVPMPYVTESSHITLLLIVTPDQRNDVLSFVDLFSRICVESADNSDLLIVFVYEDTQQKNDDIYAVLKSTILFYERKYENQGKIRYTFFKSNISDHTLVFHVLNELSKKLAENSLLALCSFGMELKIDYLNRVRISTIETRQVYFPVAFWSYKASFVYKHTPYPTSILINQKAGRYGNKIKSHASFYLSDFLYAKNKMLSKRRNFKSLYEMFVVYHTLHVLRAVDSALRVSVESFKCYKDDHVCLDNKKTALASRSQMAKLLLMEGNLENSTNNNTGRKT